MPGKNTIAWVIRSARESHGYSQEYMAEMLNIGQSAYANIESGKTALTIDRLICISEILSMDLLQLISKGLSEYTKDSNNSERKNNANLNEVYDQLILELKSEIAFLRELVKENYQLNCSPVTHTPQRNEHA